MAHSFAIWMVRGNYPSGKCPQRLKEAKYGAQYTFKYKILGGWEGEVSAKSVSRVNLKTRRGSEHNHPRQN